MAVSSYNRGQEVQLLSGISAAPTTGSSVAMPHLADGRLGDRFTWYTKVTGGPPASIQIDFQGSLNDTDFFQLDSSTLVGGEMRHIFYKPVRFVRAKLVAIGAGGGTVDVFFAA